MDVAGALFSETCLISSSGPLAMSDSEDEAPALSAHTLAALQDFYNGTSSDPAAPGGTPPDPFAVGAVEEDWVSRSGGDPTT